MHEWGIAAPPQQGLAQSTNPPSKTTPTLIGAGVGLAAGVAAGLLLKKHRGTLAALGVGGAAVGGVVGYATAGSSSTSGS